MMSALSDIDKAKALKGGAMGSCTLNTALARPLSPAEGVISLTMVSVALVSVISFLASSVAQSALLQCCFLLNSVCSLQARQRLFIKSRIWTAHPHVKGW